MEVPLGGRHCHGSQSETLITSLSYTTLSCYLVWTFLETIDINQVPRLYGSLVAMATTVNPQ